MLEIAEDVLGWVFSKCVPVNDGESQHSVQISMPFVIARTEVTQGSMPK